METEDSTELGARVKFELLLAYGTYQVRYASEKDPDWQVILKNGELEPLLSKLGHEHHTILSAIMSTWLCH